MDQARRQTILADCVKYARSARTKDMLKAMTEEGGASGGTGVAGEWMGRDYTMLRRILVGVMAEGWKVRIDGSTRPATYEILDERLEPWVSAIATLVKDARKAMWAEQALRQQGKLDTDLHILAFHLPRVEGDSRPWYDPGVIALAEDVLAQEEANPARTAVKIPVKAGPPGATPHRAGTMRPTTP